MTPLQVTTGTRANSGDHQSELNLPASGQSSTLACYITRMLVNMDHYRRKLEKITRGYFETCFLVASLCKLIPFYPAHGSTPYKRYRPFTKTYQNGLVYAVECLLAFLTLLHLYSFKAYVSQHGVDLRSTIHVIYIMVYVSALLFSVTGVLHGMQAVALLNAIPECEESELVSGSSWESDAFLQFYTLQIIPLCLCEWLGSGFVLPWIYPDGPWMLTPQIPGFSYLPSWVWIPAVCALEGFNILFPIIFLLTNAQVFFIGFTSIKMMLRQIRLVM